MGYKAHILRFPDQRFSVIETCNLGTINPATPAHQIADIYLGSLMKPPVTATAAAAAQQAGRGAGPGVSLTAAELRAVAGDYHSDELDVTYHLLVDGTHLVLRRPTAPPVALQAIDRNTFRAGTLTLHVTGGGGTAKSFTIEAGRVRNIRFDRR